MQNQDTLFPLPAATISANVILQRTSQITDAHIEAFVKTLSWCSYSTSHKYAFALRSLCKIDVPFDARILCAYDAACSAKKLTSRESEIAGIKRFLWFGAMAGWLPAVSIDHARELLRNQRGAQRFEYTPKVPNMAACRAVVDYWLNMPLPPPGNPKIHACPRFTILRNRAIFLSLISTGARISEVMSLNLMQFASGENSAWICGKRKLWRYIFFAPAACDAIQEYIVERNRLFPNETEHLWISSTFGTGLTTNAINAMLAHTLKMLGLPPGTVTPHSYRHYVATEMLHLGFSIHQIQKYLGHTTATTTSRVYAHVLDEDRRRAVQSYHQAALQFNKRHTPQPRQFVPVPSAPQTTPVPAPPPPGSYAYFPTDWQSSISAVLAG